MTIEESLQPENMLFLYSQGAFPMADEFGQIDWYFPQIRTIIPLDSYNIPRSLKKVIDNNNYEILYSKNPVDVIRSCADRPETWITEELIDAYQNLITLGFLHSVEVYEDESLVGGLYGVSIKGVFFGESMFSKKTQTSKISMYYLLKNLKEKQFVFIDVQYQSEHLKMFGSQEITLDEYKHYLKRAYKKNRYFI